MQTRGAFLGQAQIREGTGFAGPIYYPGGHASYGTKPPPAGAQAMTTRINDPWGPTAGKRCYQTRDGSHRLLTITQVESMRAAGMAVTPAPENQCAGLGSRMGQGAPAALVFLRRQNGLPIDGLGVDVFYEGAENGAKSGITDSKGVAQVDLPEGTTVVTVTPNPVCSVDWSPPSIRRDISQGNHFEFEAVLQAGSACEATVLPKLPPPGESALPLGIPTWAAVAGGLGILGLVGYALSR